MQDLLHKYVYASTHPYPQSSHDSTHNQA